MAARANSRQEKQKLCGVSNKAKPPPQKRVTTPGGSIIGGQGHSGQSDRIRVGAMLPLETPIPYSKEKATAFSVSFGQACIIMHRGEV